MAGRKPISACNRFVEKCEPNGNGCIEWTGGRTQNGYGLFSPSDRTSRGQMVTAHRWLYEQVNGPVLAGIDVCHSCDNRLCVNIDHLFAGTRKENMEDAVRKGRMDRTHKAKGEAHGRAVLTMDQVKEIRRLRPLGWTLASLSRQFGVSLQQIHRIVNNQLWR